VSSDINYEELARSTDDFNAAQLKAVRGCANRLDVQVACFDPVCGFSEASASGHQGQDIRVASG
jgi:hypothetical protein